ncbi:hypothetical protein H6P81_004399 [Aristolochia fimbriata]|uniref:Coenzyme Q-binding protein COQ10 START domain-containing protein n=1 Tax=Aristolochia fimbriata TaxID=158543 RepID=A0AAV7FGC0_ARIFI|nr:hypothetical protein H6P81_004399 [Aristolochia fimbriata]
MLIPYLPSAMSAAATLFISGPRSLPQFKVTGKGAFPRTIFTGNGVLKLSMNQLLFGIPGRLKKRNSLTGVRPISPVMEWQDCTVKLEVDVPISVAYDCYSDRESIPHWMPFITSVKILEDKPDLSRWSLKYTAFGQDLEFAWLARNMQPIPNQKIHWRSLEGLPNKGAVRFYPKGPSSCLIELTVSYEIPQILIPFASALRPLLERLLLIGLRRFAKFAEESQQKSPKA